MSYDGKYRREPENTNMVRIETKRAENRPEYAPTCVFN